MKEESDGPSYAAITQHLRRAREATEYQSAQEELQAALEKLEKLQGSSRSNLELVAWMNYAIIADHFGDLTAAVEFNEKLALARPDGPYSHLALARSYSRLGNAEKAAESLRRCGELAERFDNKTILAILAAKGHLPKEADARARRLEDAVATYRETLKDFTLEVSPEGYAATQRVLGSLYRHHAELLSGSGRERRLEDAIAAYREALKVYTPGVFPEDNRALLENIREVEKLLNNKS